MSLPPRFNLAEDVLAAGRATPDKIALALVSPRGAERWSYARLEAAVLGTATGLLEAGLAPGARVLLRLGNDVAFPVAYLGAIAAGLVPVPTSVQLTQPEIEKVSARLSPSLVLASAGVPVPGGVPVMTEAELRALETRPPAAYRMGDPDRPAYVILTSGTTAEPRLVSHAHRAIRARRMMWSGWYGLTAQDRLMHAGAFNWTYTLGTGLMDPWAIGATALIPAPGTDPAALPLLMKRHDATIFAAAPGIYRRLLRGAGPLDLPRLRHGLSAGEKLPEPLREDWRRATGTEIHEAFGQSEISTFISGCPGRPAPPGTLGYPQGGRRVAILDDAGQPAPPGQPGLIAVHRSDPGLMLGYLGDPEATAERFRGDWYLTGDTGAQTAEGAIRYLGRDDDMLNAGGIRVSPLEIETAMATLPGLAEAAAVAHEVRPDTWVIALHYTGPAPLPEAELSAHAARLLAAYKVPRVWVFEPELPRGANGKLLRRALRRSYRGV